MMGLLIWNQCQEFLVFFGGVPQSKFIYIGVQVNCFSTLIMDVTISVNVCLSLCSVVVGEIFL